MPGNTRTLNDKLIKVEQYITSRHFVVSLFRVLRKGTHSSAVSAKTPPRKPPDCFRITSCRLSLLEINFVQI